MKFVAIVWVAIVIGAMVALANFSNRPGLFGDTPARWPGQSQIPLDEHRPTLVMFVHPHCPCTQASVGELERLIADCQGQFKARVEFVKLAGTADDWAKTDLWHRVAAIPGVSIQQDDDGVEARRFQAETSGFTVMYDASGKLQFAGGITISRGHSGDNPGRTALEAILAHGFSAQVTTPVFGCSLFGTECRKADAP